MSTPLSARLAPAPLPAAAPAGSLALATLVLLLALPWPAAADSSSERSVGGHRWLAPVWISAPATSALALAGFAGLALHLFRRRRNDNRNAARPAEPSQDDADFAARLAVWERRLRRERHPRRDAEQPNVTARLPADGDDGPEEPSGGR